MKCPKGCNCHKAKNITLVTPQAKETWRLAKMDAPMENFESPTTSFGVQISKGYALMKCVNANDHSQIIAEATFGPGEFEWIPDSDKNITPEHRCTNAA